MVNLFQRSLLLIVICSCATTLADYREREEEYHLSQKPNPRYVHNVREGEKHYFRNYIPRPSYRYFYPRPWYHWNPLERPTYEPLVFKWNYKADGNCDLSCVFTYYERGDPRCDLQYVTLGDELVESKYCGYARFPDAFSSSNDGEYLTIEHYRKTGTRPTDFMGYVTCIPGSYDDKYGSNYGYNGDYGSEYDYDYGNETYGYDNYTNGYDNDTYGYNDDPYEDNTYGYDGEPYDDNTYGYDNGDDNYDYGNYTSEYGNYTYENGNDTYDDGNYMAEDNLYEGDIQAKEADSTPEFRASMTETDSEPGETDKFGNEDEVDVQPKEIERTPEIDSQPEEIISPQDLGTHAEEPNQSDNTDFQINENPPHFENKNNTEIDFLLAHQNQAEFGLESPQESQDDASKFQDRTNNILNPTSNYDASKYQMKQDTDYASSPAPSYKEVESTNTASAESINSNQNFQSENSNVSPGADLDEFINNMMI